ncbi:hypothetical protein GTQ40_11510 [Flavobacteriaceae bacterium R38]|nr:hypothetical protein [Flavobacteriaceae bacterium R38]
MNSFSTIKTKLEKFIKKYYFNELIKGAILFFSIGLLYFLATIFIEQFLWLGKTGRTILFWLFVTVEIGLLVKFIFIPLAKLFNLKKGIGYKEASLIIGSHFPEVDDKLINILQLSEDNTESELLLASIEQKSTKIQPIPFHLAINFKKNTKYLKYALIPLAILLIVFITGNSTIFSNSYKRVVNYNTAYTPPAPFEFLVVNNEMTAIENKPFDLYIKTVGDVIPEEIEIHIGNENYFLQNTGSNNFKYSIGNTDSSFEFYLSGNGVRSEDYKVNVVKVPTLVNFEMILDYPSYTKKKDEVLKSTGNATIPEGTSINWRIDTKETEQVELLLKDTVFNFNADENMFSFSKKLYNDLDYEIGTSNDELKRYERLGFSIDVVKDAFPDIEVMSRKDSLSADGTLFFLGELSDDYGLQDLKVIYYEENSEEEKNEKAIPIEKSIYDQFTYAFPSDLPLKEGVNYEFYFEVTDNDAIHGGKKTKSQTFNYRKLTTSELEQEQLRKQNETISGIDNSLDKLKEQQKELQELSKTQKEKRELNFNDKKKLQNFFQRQKQQEQLMQNFTKELQENLKDFQKEEEDDEYKKLLEERLEREQKELEKNEKLLEELEKITDKLSKEELARKIEQLAKQQQNSKRNLEQVLELTKRYYVSAKASKIQKDLEELAKKQEELSEKSKEENNKEAQDNLNKQFDELKKDLEELEKSNEELKKPMELERDEETEKQISKEQEEASENLEKEEQSGNQQEQDQQKNKAKKNQKNAAKKIKQLSEQLQQQIQQGGQEGESEDAETLRQILDNLVLFSFDEERVLNKFSEIDNSNASFARELRKQNDLRDLFKHVDDSLFALSLRRPEISEEVNKNITDVYFNIDKALERLAENRIGQGVASQQYALTAANNLADFLSNVLDNLQQNMSSGKGKSKGQGFQLPDIIQSQEQINQQFKEGLDKKEGGKEKGKGEKEGEGKDGENGKNGEKGGEQNGKDGQGSQGQGEEGLSQELYEIFKQQQQLRLALEQQLKDKLGRGEKGNEDRLLREVEQIESELLERGFNERTLQRLTRLKHQLLKLEEASFQQGEKKERESKTNTKEYRNNAINQELNIKQYFNQVEILNRQVLPLRQIYKKKVQTYFKGND